MVGVNVRSSKDIFYVTMKTGLRSGETLWEQWPQICHHEHYTQVDHAVFVHLEHHHQLYHHQIITFANIDIFERPPLRTTYRPNLNFATKTDNTSVNWDELKGRLSSFQVAAPELTITDHHDGADNLFTSCHSNTFPPYFL